MFYFFYLCLFDPYFFPVISLPSSPDYTPKSTLVKIADLYIALRNPSTVKLVQEYIYDMLVHTHHFRSYITVVLFFFSSFTSLLSLSLCGNLPVNQTCEQALSSRTQLRLIFSSLASIVGQSSDGNHRFWEHHG